MKAVKNISRVEDGFSLQAALLVNSQKKNVQVETKNSKHYVVALANQKLQRSRLVHEE